MSGTAAKLSAVAAGGAIGAALRYLASLATVAVVGKAFPYHTLFVNLLGSFLIGLLLVLVPWQADENHLLKLALYTGVLGGFTTYSAFSLETLQLLHNGETLKAGLNVVLTVVLCLLAVFVGHALGKALQ